MNKLELRVHPNVIFAYHPNHIEMIIRVENHGETAWTEAELTVPERLSLSPDNSLRKGRVRIGIVEHNHFLEKAIRMYANTYTNPQMYRCKVTLYVYNKDGVIGARLENSIDIRCEIKKNAVL